MFKTRLFFAVFEGVGLRAWWRYVRDAWALLGQRWPERLLAALAATAAALALGLAAPYFVKLIIDEAVVAADGGVLWRVAALGFGLYVASAWCAWASRWWMGLAQERLHRGLRQRLFDAVLGQEVGRSRALASGHWISRVEADAAEITGLFTQVLPGALGVLLQVLGTGVILLVMAPKLTLLSALPLPIFLGLGWWFERRVRPATRRHLEARTRLYGVLSEVFDGVEAVLTYRGQELVGRWLDAHAGEVEAQGLALWRARAVVFPVLELGLSLALLGVLLVGASWAAAGELSVGTLAAYYFYIARTLSPVRGLPGVVFGWHRATAAVERAKALLDAPRWPAQAGELVLEAGAQPQPLRFVEVSFGYEGSSALALERVSFELGPGQRVAILGPSGAGKSTLGRLVPRLMDPDEGQLCYGEVPISALSVEAWRAAVGYVGQEVFLFEGTLRENVCFGAAEVDEAAFERAVALACVTPLAAEHTLGFARRVGQRGQGLSGGQRKRVALARALLGAPRVLIIDQLASELEQELNRQIFEGLAALAQPLAILYLGHRLPEGFVADAVYRLEGGRLVLIQGGV